MHKLISEKESDTHNITLDAHNVTVYTLSQTSNTQRENSIVIFTSEKLVKSDSLVES